MHVQDRQGRQHPRWRPPIIALLGLALAALAGAAQAVDFDEKLKTPVMKSQADLRSQAQAYGTRFAAIRETAPEQFIRNASFAREKFDVVWQIQRAIDERKPLEELAESGITLMPDGSYLVDTKSHPEWNDLHQTIALFLSGENLEHWLPLLADRGFRPADLEIVREYLGMN